MKKNLRGFKGLLALSLIILIVLSVKNIVPRGTILGPAADAIGETDAETNLESIVEGTLTELELLKQENSKTRNELVKYKTKVQGKANKIPVLMYHHFLKEETIKAKGYEKNTSIISVESFKEQMDYLYQNDFHTLTLAELEEYLYKDKDLPKKSILLTFDDGYSSNAEYAYPIMKEYGFKGTIFMIGKNTEIEPSEFSQDKLGYISNQEIGKYTDVFEFECHTYGMHPMVDGKHPLISSPMADIEKDLKKNRELYSTTAIAYPHGAYNQNLIDLLVKEDYKLGFAGKVGYVNKKSNPFELKRFGIYPYINIGKFARIVNGKE